MGIIRRLREWREKADGTLTGPALEVNDVDNHDAPTNLSRDESDTGTWFQVDADQDTIIYIQFRIRNSPSSVRVILEVNDTQTGKNICQFDENDPINDDTVTMTAIVPANGYYRIKDVDGGGFVIPKWSEQT